MRIRQSPIEIAGPPRASFLGLPVELRLHIYSFIPAPHKPRRTRSRHYGCHIPISPCCAIRTYDMSILAVNKQIFTEAYPIIYQTAEVATNFPWCPRERAAHVRYFFVLCDHLKEGWCFDRGSMRIRRGQNRWVADLWFSVKIALPNLRQIRLRIDHPGEATVHPCAIPAERSLFGLSALENLRCVIVESYVYRSRSTKSNRAKIAANLIKTEVKQAGREISVLEESLEHCICEGPTSCWGNDLLKQILAAEP